MLIGIGVYFLLFAKSFDSLIVMVLVASLRIFDAFEDVFYSEFQRQGRLDIAGKASLARILITTASFCLTVFFSRDLLTSVLVTIAATSLALLILVVPPAMRMFDTKPSFAWKPIRRLLWECFTLFLAAFLAMYLNNAPRYAIVDHLSEELWGTYAILFMPAFAISLLTMLVFRPFSPA